MTTFNVNSLTAIAPITTPSATGAISYGALGYLDANAMLSLQSSANTYVQAVIQNTNAGTAASADLVVSNNLGTASTYFVNLGMNSSTYTGSGSYNLPNAGYVTSTSGDLVLGTTTNNAIHFIVNGGTTDAMTITGTGTVNFGGGAAGSFLYQTAPGITAYLPIGASGYVLQSTGSAPVWAATGAYTPGSVAITGGSITGTSVSVADTAFTITNLADPTKKVTFSASGVTTGTTSNITVPGVSGTLAILNAVQTFTATQNVNASFNTTGTTALATGTGGVTTIGSSAIASTTTIGGGATTSTISLNGVTTATGVLNAPASIVSPSVYGKNVLINGDMSISQENGGAAVTPTISGYVLDMWGNSLAQPSKLTFQQVTNKLNSLGAPVAELITTASAYTAASTDAFDFQQPIEGLNFSRFMYGTAYIKPASLQFKANASIAGTYSGSIANSAGTRSYVFTFVLAANTDTLVTIQNIPGDSGGTWVGATNASAAILRFDLGSGSTFRSSTINAWQAGNIIGATGAVSLVATAGATLAISEVQFELGSVCTAYERKLISQSLAECQRYLEIGTQLGLYIGTINVYTATAYGFIKFLSTKRAPPTMTYSNFQYYSSGIYTTFTPNTNSATNDSALYGSTSLTNWNGWSAVGTWTADARL